MLELESVHIRNFLSYGDYPTWIPLSQLHQCLISGTNGAGKSSAPNAILWCLFGRTMHSPNPGDKVVNHYTGKDCVVQLKFKNGDSITRTRNAHGGLDELLYVKNGNERHLTSDTLSTAKLQQAHLTRTFSLDWNLFCGSAFFTQYGKPWLEMPDAARKQAIEKILRIDRFLHRADVAKDKCSVLDSTVEKQRAKHIAHQANLKLVEAELVRVRSSATNFEADRQARADDIFQRHTAVLLERDAIDLPDLQGLQQKWSIVQKIDSLIKQHQQRHTELSHQIHVQNTQATSLQDKIAVWRERSGKVCTRCEQSVPAEHTSAKLEPLESELAVIRSSIATLSKDHHTLSSTIRVAREQLQQRQPQVSIAAADDVHRMWQSRDAEAARLLQQHARIQHEENPHTQSIAALETRIAELHEQISILSQEFERYAVIYRHYKYIHRTYADRNKLRSRVFDKYIPYLNERLRHYLDVFGLDVHVTLTNSLSITSNLWSYDFLSGGERKRTDVAFMLAVHDLHTWMFGRVCNILVLDEVDGRLDDEGVSALIEIIKNDLAQKVETVLVISHKDLMRDVFPNDLHVTRTDRFSYAELTKNILGTPVL